MLKKSTPLLLSILLSCSSSVFAARFIAPEALDDNFIIVQNQASNSVIGDVFFNDTNGSSFQLNSPPVSDYGFLVFNPDGSFIYTIYDNSPAILDLKVGDVVTDTFSYTLHGFGQSVSAKINIQIVGNPVDEGGNTIFVQSEEFFDNVDVEFNDSFTQATPLNSGKSIKGHFHSLGDRDWYRLASAGNEVITLEVCPKGTSCFGQKSWVLYVFDSDLLTEEIENRTFPLKNYLDETGSSFDLTGDDILENSGVSLVNDMYLLYRVGAFSEALIGVIDPCFDKTNSVDIGVGSGARDYLIAISTPLRGDADDLANPEECGQGSVVLEEAGRQAIGSDFATETGGDSVKVSKTYATTQEFITFFPYSDDQYFIKITGTGINPLLSDEAQANAAIFSANTRTLNIPKVRIPTKNGGSSLYEANLKLSETSSSPLSNNLSFFLENISELSLGEVVDAYQATYNPENRQVLIPRVTETGTDKAYSIIMQYYFASAGSPARLEIIDVKLIE